MLDFIFKNYSHLTHALEALAAVTGFILIRKYKDTAAIYFIYLLVYLFIVDTLGSYTYYIETIDFLRPLKNTRFKSNHWWFTIFFDVIAVSLYGTLYLKIISSKFFKRVISVGLIVFLSFSLGNILIDFNQLFKGSYILIYILQALLLITCTSLYFLELINSERLINFSKSLYFYISVVVFLWWLIVTPLVFFDQYFITEDQDFVKLKYGIYIFSNMFMYIAYTLALIVSKPEKST